MSDKVLFIPIDQLESNPFQPREKIHKEELEELATSIRTYGILEPLVIAQTPAGYQIIAGERRWRAARQAGLTTVPVVIKETTPRGMLEMAIVENVQRIDLSAIERAQAYQQLMRDFKFSISEIAEKVGKSQSHVSNSLRLLKLPDAIKDGLISGAITEGHARALIGIPDEKAMVDCFKIILKENASVRRAEELSRRFRDPDMPVNHFGRRISVNDEEIKKWEKSFQGIFHSKTRLNVMRSAKQTRLSIILLGPPEETQSDFKKIIAFAERKAS